jgi:DNA-binding transcriptional LysR family regulator
MATIDAIGAAANHRLELVHRINEFAVVAEVVAAGGGLALIPRWTARPHPAVVLRPLRNVHARRHIDALHRPERTARQAVRTVLTTLRQAATHIRRSDGLDAAPGTAAVKRR